MRCVTALLALGLPALPGVPLSAQVLSRPGWAGSGVRPELWWHSAVFYRIAPDRFQDSDGNGVGDLAGITARLDYLRSLGADALVIDGHFDPAGLDDLMRGASQRGLRVVFTVRTAPGGGVSQAMLAEAHGWLSAGAAALWAPPPPGPAASVAGYPVLLSMLRSMLRSFPGARVLLSGSADPAGASPPPDRAPGAQRRGRASFAGDGIDGQLVGSVTLPVDQPDAAALRAALTAVAASSSPSALLRFAEDPRTGDPNAAVYAALLLASRGAALFDFGDEIGLNTSPAATHAQGPSRAAALPLMQWTPANIEQTPQAAPVERVAPVVRPGQTAFGPYIPYVHPPPPRLTGPDPAAPAVALDGNIPPPPPSPDTLPGFTTGRLPVAPVDGDRINVATEDRDPHSLLNDYRRLIALHHGNGSLRDGAQAVLQCDAPEAAAWVRRAPAGSRIDRDVIVAANMGDHAITLSLDGELKRAGVRGGPLRVLFTSAPELLTGERTDALLVPAHAVVVGELYRP